jgi:hypothetical protein
MNSVDYKSGEPGQQGGSHEHGKAGTREGGMQERWSRVEKWLIEYVRTPGLFLSRKDLWREEEVEEEKKPANTGAQCIYIP